MWRLKRPPGDRDAREALPWCRDVVAQVSAGGASHRPGTACIQLGCRELHSPAGQMRELTDGYWCARAADAATRDRSIARVSGSSE